MKILRAVLCSRIQLVLVVLAAVALVGCGEQRIATGTGNDDAGDEQEPDAGSSDADEDADGGSGGGSDADGGDPFDDDCLQTDAQDARDFVEDYSTELCERMLACEENSKISEFVSIGGWDSVESCAHDVQSETLTADQAAEAVEQDDMRLDSCESQDCLDGLGDLDCLAVDRLLTEARFAELTSCPDAFYGVREDGQACSIDAQCAGKAACDRGDEECLGECVEADSAGSGQCGDIVCRADQYCSTDNNICKSRGDHGSPCEEDYECVRDARCSGGECTNISRGQGEGSVCNFDDRLCSLELACLQGECGEMPAESEPCPQYGCAGNAYCNSDEVCAPRKGAGEECSSNAECSSFRCVDEECTDRNSLCPDD